MMQEQTTLSVVVAFIPLVTLFGIEFYVGRFEGWGAWATAPLVLLPAIIGISVGLVFLANLVHAYREKQAILWPLFLMFVSLSPVVWLFIRRFVV